MAKAPNRSGKTPARNAAPTACRAGRRRTSKLFSPLVLSSLIQAVSRIIVALVS